MHRNADGELPRQEYAVEKDITDRSEATFVCTATLEVLRPHLRLAIIDAYTDYADELTTSAATAQAWIRQRGSQQRHRSLLHRLGLSDPAMAVHLDLSQEAEWEILRGYAPWSIGVWLYGPGGLELGSFHDSGYSVVAALTDEERDVLVDELGPVAPLVRLDELHARRKAQRVTARLHRRRRRSNQTVGLCSNFSHPAFGVIALSQVSDPLPLEERDLPRWFNELPESRQDEMFRSWWEDVVTWLSTAGATRMRVQVAPFDRALLDSAGFQRADPHTYEARWTPELGRALLEANPESIEIWAEDKLLLSQYATWDGVTTEQPIEPLRRP
ncbi:hypothetical protein ATJ97_2445 [Georgenia soli]|uniref:Uncharacterized protein n=1 Tax=Georgenia soli TaxID=638953 RepID=A0A2A9ENV4_9MICO|nr:hypothetical protein [Georgenia soli]PFG39925.1 hypothetical protein ATJ97_2445 [Georgenia soli]